jgi:Bacterial type II and III secretion system protein
LLGDIPGIGWLFTSRDDSSTRTDVLLTITPRVVRGWDMPDKESQMFASGSDDRFDSQPLFRGFGATKIPNVSKIDVIPSANRDAKTKAVPAKVLAEATSVDDSSVPVKDIASSSQPLTSGQPPLFAFSETVYESVSGKDFEIKLTGDNFDKVTGLSAEILYNPQLVKYLRNEPGSVITKEYKVEADETRGTLRVKLTYPDNAPSNGSSVLARIVLQGVKPGNSFITYREPTLAGANDVAANIQVRSSRVVVK